MNRNLKIVRLFAFIIGVVAILVMLGWVFDVGLLKSLNPSWVTMKLHTSVAFLLTALILYYIGEDLAGRSQVAVIVLPLASFVMALIMWSLLFSVLFDSRSGLEQWLVIEDIVKTAMPGRPSVPNMLNFILISLGGLMTIFHPAHLKTILSWLGGIIAVTGAVACIGYLLDAPLLYYYIAGVNTAMAAHTAILFVLIGAGLLLLGRQGDTAQLDADEPSRVKDAMSPVRLLTILVFMVFGIEMLIMNMFTVLPSLSPWYEALVDSAVLAALLFPILYFLVFRPLTMINMQQARQLDELQRFHEVTIGRELRMKELVEENQALNPTRKPLVKPLRVSDAMKEEQQHTALLFMLEDLERSRNQIEQANHEWVAAMDAIADPIFMHDKDYRIMRCNRAYTECAGMSVEAIIGKPYYEVFPKLDGPLPSCCKAQQEEEKEEEEEIQIASGEIFVSSSFSVRNVDGNYLYSLHVMKDITERKQAEKSLEIAASVYQAIGEAVMIADADNHIIAINPAFTKITGYTAAEAVGRDTTLLKSGKQDLDFYRAMWQTLERTDHWQGEIINRRKDGELYPEWMGIHNIRDEHGEVIRRIALFSDITEQKQTRETIWRQANYDELTGLANRRMFRDRLEQGIKNAVRDKSSLALLFLDLDHFKEINDTLGHDLGDILLIEAARRIVDCVRESDTVARLGGDEFAIILQGVSAAASIEQVAQNIIVKLAAPFPLGEEAAFVTASIGIALYPDDAVNVDDLLKYADQAMYVVKTTGRNHYSYFTPALQQAAETRGKLINDLHGALDDDQFRVYYQPIVELATGVVRKAEALIRWQHPQRGLVSPDEFIPLAEETGMIVEIGDWVFREVVRQVKHLRENYPDFQISVNTSPVQYHQDERKRQETWIEYLREQGLPGQALVAEITEGLLLDAAPQVTVKLLAFRDAGIGASLDDFGTGYSSLSYLKKFDIDYLKIDKSFVHNMENDANDIALCEAIIVMAHKLDIKVIAEGVETEAQRDLLQQAGCDFIQGYLYSKPLPIAEFEAFLKTQ